MINPNDSAFPADVHGVTVPKHLMTPELAIAMKEIVNKIPGLTKREYFAAMAMSGICTSTSNGTWTKIDGPFIAESAIAIADALIAELNK